MVGLLLMLVAQRGDAQRIGQGISSQSGTDSFSETGSVSGMFEGPNGFFQFGGSAPPFAPLGGQGFSGGGISGGVGFGESGFSGNLNFHFAQGASHSITSRSAGVTTMDGYPGGIHAQTIRPFVTGLVPIVSSAATSHAEVAQNRRQLAKLRESQAATQNKKLQSYLQRAETAFERKKYTMARANLKSAIRFVGKSPSNVSLRLQLETQMRQLGALLQVQKREARLASRSKGAP